MVTAFMNRPVDMSISSTFFTLPETLEYTGEDTNPPGLAMSCPTLTASPGFTTGSAGAPMCMDMGIVTDPGAGIRTGAIPAVFFLWGTWTPCSLGNFTFLPSHTDIPLSIPTFLSIAHYPCQY